MSDWHGAHNHSAHRTVGTHRAWCHLCIMWCYSGVPASDNNCHCCLEAAGYVMTPGDTDGR